MSGPRPLSRPRSAWEESQTPASVEATLRASGAVSVRTFVRKVGDGTLYVFVSREPLGAAGALEWHLSISHRDHRGGFRRYPSWDEIAHARYELLPPDLTFVMYLPPAEEYVAVHPTTFHLHEDPRSAR